VLALCAVALLGNVTPLLLLRRLAQTDTAVFRLAGEVNLSAYTVAYVVGLLTFALWASYVAGRWAGNDYERGR